MSRGHNHDHSHNHHGHDHHDHHHTFELKSLDRTFIICIVLNLLFVGCEATVGLLHNSMSLLSDAGHNLSDVFSLSLALFAFRLAKVHSTSRFTYGYKKGTIFISLLNAVILFCAVGVIIWESIYKLRTPFEVSGEAIAWTAAIGIIVNGTTTLLLMKSRNHDLNSRGAYLHMAMDTLVSAGVVVSGVVITHTGLTIIDPIISILIAVVILYSTWSLLKESFNLLLDSVPANIDVENIQGELGKIEGVSDIHHIHIWAIGTQENAATLHVVVDDIMELGSVREAIRGRLKELGIAHSTIEIEPKGYCCSDPKCC